MAPSEKVFTWRAGRRRCPATRNGLGAALDGLKDLGVGSMDQVPDLPIDVLLPSRNGFFAPDDVFPLLLSQI